MPFSFFISSSLHLFSFCCKNIDVSFFLFFLHLLYLMLPCSFTIYSILFSFSRQRQARKTLHSPLLRSQSSYSYLFASASLFTLSLFAILSFSAFLPLQGAPRAGDTLLRFSSSCLPCSSLLTAVKIVARLV